MEVERQVRRHIGVRGLFVRQHDVEPNRLAPCVIRPTVAGLHHSRPAAGADDVFAAIGQKAAFGDGFGKAPGLVVIGGEAGQTGGAGVAGVSRDPRAAEQDDGGFDAFLVQNHLRFQQFQLQPHAAQFFARHEIIVDESEAIGGRPGLRRIRQTVRSSDILSRIAKGLGTVVGCHGGP